MPALLERLHGTGLPEVKRLACWVSGGVVGTDQAGAIFFAVDAVSKQYQED